MEKRVKELSQKRVEGVLISEWKQTKIVETQRKITKKTIKLLEPAAKEGEKFFNKN